MKYDDIHFTPDPNYRAPVVKSLYGDEFLSNITWFAPTLENLVSKRFQITEVHQVETAKNAYGDKPVTGTVYKGVALEFAERNGKESFTMEIYRVYKEGRRLYSKQRGEIRYFHRNRAAVKKMGLDKVPLAFYLKMCANDKVRGTLMKAAEKTEVFLFQDTPLESAESKANRARASALAQARHEEALTKKDKLYTMRRKIAANQY